MISGIIRQFCGAKDTRKTVLIDKKAEDCTPDLLVVRHCVENPSRLFAILRTFGDVL